MSASKAKAINPHRLEFRDIMPPTKIKGFLQQFPWVLKLVDEAITQAYVSRMDATTLQIRPGVEFGQPTELICLLNNEGVLVTRTEKKFRRRFGFFGRKVEVTKLLVDGILHTTSVEEKLGALGESAREVRYVLWYKYHPSDTRWYPDYGVLVLYKAPKDVSSVKAWVKQLVDTEAAQYRTAAETIDAEIV